MQKIFEEYGGVIVTVIAVVALIGLVVFLMADNSVMAGAFTDITNMFIEKSNALINDVGTIE